MKWKTSTQVQRLPLSQRSQGSGRRECAIPLMFPQVLHQQVGKHSHPLTVPAQPLASPVSGQWRTWITALEFCKLRGEMLGLGAGPGVSLPSHSLPVLLQVRVDWASQHWSTPSSNPKWAARPPAGTGRRRFPRQWRSKLLGMVRIQQGPWWALFQGPLPERGKNGASGGWNDRQPEDRIELSPWARWSQLFKL